MSTLNGETDGFREVICMAPQFSVKGGNGRPAAYACNHAHSLIRYNLISNAETEEAVPEPAETKPNASIQREAAALLALLVAFVWLTRVFLRPEPSALTHPLAGAGLLFFLLPFRKNAACSRGVWLAIAAIAVWLAGRLSIVWIPFATAFVLCYLLRMASQELQTLRLPGGRELRLPAYAANTLIALMLVGGTALAGLVAAPSLAGQTAQLVDGIRTAYTHAFDYRLRKIPLEEARTAIAEWSLSQPKLAKAAAAQDGTTYAEGTPVTTEMLNALEASGHAAAPVHSPSHSEQEGGIPIAEARALLKDWTNSAPLTLAETIDFYDGEKFAQGAAVTNAYLDKLESIGVDTASVKAPSYLQEWREDGGWIRRIQAAVIEEIGPEYVEPILAGAERWAREMTAALSRQFPKALADALGFSTRLITDAVGVLVMGVFSLIILAYLLAGYDRYLKAGLNLFPEKERGRVRRIARLVDANMKAFVRSQFMIIIAVAALSTLAYALAGIPFALLIGVLGGLLNVIPNIGPTLAGVSAFFALTIGWIAGLRPNLLFFIESDGLRGYLIRAALIPIAVFLVQSVDNALISPRVFSRAMNIDPLAIMLCILTGGIMFGFWGVLLAIPGLIAVRSALEGWNA